MSAFMAYFLLCNVWIAIFTGVLLAVKHFLKKQLSGRLQYAFGGLVFLLLCTPFLPFRPTGFPQALKWLRTAEQTSVDTAPMAGMAKTVFPIPAMDWMNDFAVSVNRKTPLAFCGFLFFLWISGMLAMLVFLGKAGVRLYLLERSALPLQNRTVRRLYEKCLRETGIRRRIPVYSSAFFRSPVFAGFFRPRIYLPIHLISDGNTDSIRYMLLHELQHYKHRDSLVNLFSCIARTVYWFHPLVWLAMREVQTDREIACDSSVLRLLPQEEYMDYENTLICFAEKVSSTVSLFATGMGGSLKQLRKRILNISAYRHRTKGQSLRGVLLFILFAVLLLESTGLMPVYASQDTFFPDDSGLPSNLSALPDLSSFFGEYDGCFVLYDSGEDIWQVYNEDRAVMRTSPASTYKIYSALMGLENGQINPDSSFMEWDGKTYPIAQWNRDHTLSSALRDSVNWYFQALDEEAGMEKLTQFYQRLDYGNCDLSGGVSGFWMESSLKISPVEQVELLRKLYDNEFGFAAQNVQAVKDALTLSHMPSYVPSSPSGFPPAVSSGISLHGKTGTGSVNGENVNGWFIGYAETSDNVYFFAVNIQNGKDASGSNAGRIALEILGSQGIG